MLKIVVMSHWFFSQDRVMVVIMANYSIGLYVQTAASSPSPSPLAHVLTRWWSGHDFLAVLYLVVGLRGTGVHYGAYTSVYAVSRSMSIYYKHCAIPGVIFYSIYG